MGRRGGSKPGERRGGRRKGTPNKSAGPLRAIAAAYGPAAIKELAAIGLDPETKSKIEAVRIGAIKELLDRGYGRPPQAHQLFGSTDDAWDLTRLSDEELRVLETLARRACGPNTEPN